MLVVDGYVPGRAFDFEAMPAPRSHTAPPSTLFPKSCYDPLEVFIDSISLPPEYADRMMGFGLSYGAVVTMPLHELLVLSQMIMTPEHSQLFVHNVQMVGKERRQVHRKETL